MFGNCWLEAHPLPQIPVWLFAHSLAKGVWDNVMVYIKTLSVTVGRGICCEVGCSGSSSSANGCSLYLLRVTSHQEHCPFSPSNALISTAPTWRQIILLEFLGPRRQEGGVCVEWLTCCGMLKNQCAVDGSWAQDLSGSALSGHRALLRLLRHSAAMHILSCGFLLWPTCTCQPSFRDSSWFLAHHGLSLLSRMIMNLFTYFYMFSVISNHLGWEVEAAACVQFAVLDRNHLP